MEQNKLLFYLETLHTSFGIPLVYRSADEQIYHFQPFSVATSENELDFIVQRLRGVHRQLPDCHIMFLQLPTLVMLGLVVASEGKEFVFVGPVAAVDAREEDIADYLFAAGLSAEATRQLLRCFCHYYIEKEPENCFVCESDGTICGYVLCAENFEKWEAEMKHSYMKDAPISTAIGSATIENLRPCAKNYPAHLHIDLAPEAQGKGLGTQLLQQLIRHLKEKGISGLMLDVAADNTGAQRFYARNGFSVLDSDEHSIRMGILLAQKSILRGEISEREAPQFTNFIR